MTTRTTKIEAEKLAVLTSKYEGKYEEEHGRGERGRESESLRGEGPVSLAVDDTLKDSVVVPGDMPVMGEVLIRCHVLRGGGGRGRHVLQIQRDNAAFSKSQRANAKVSRQLAGKKGYDNNPARGLGI